MVGRIVGTNVDEVLSTELAKRSRRLCIGQEALSLQFSGISIPAYVISIPCTPGAKNSFK